jgi:hypothetical protein
MKVNVAEGLYSYNARLLVCLLLFTWDFEDENNFELVFLADCETRPRHYTHSTFSCLHSEP